MAESRIGKVKHLSSNVSLSTFVDHGKEAREDGPGQSGVEYLLLVAFKPLDSSRFIFLEALSETKIAVYILDDELLW